MPVDATRKPDGYTARLREMYSRGKAAAEKNTSTGPIRCRTRIVTPAELKKWMHRSGPWLPSYTGNPHEVFTMLPNGDWLVIELNEDDVKEQG